MGSRTCWVVPFYLLGLGVILELLDIHRWHYKTYNFVVFNTWHSWLESLPMIIVCGFWCWEKDFLQNPSLDLYSDESVVMLSATFSLFSFVGGTPEWIHNREVIV